MSARRLRASRACCPATGRRRSLCPSHARPASARRAARAATRRHTHTHTHTHTCHPRSFWRQAAWSWFESTGSVRRITCTLLARGRRPRVRRAHTSAAAAVSSFGMRHRTWPPTSTTSRTATLKFFERLFEDEIPTTLKVLLPTNHPPLLSCVALAAWPSPSRRIRLSGARSGPTGTSGACLPACSARGAADGGRAARPVVPIRVRLPCCRAWLWLAGRPNHQFIPRMVCALCAPWWQVVFIHSPSLIIPQPALLPPPFSYVHPMRLNGGAVWWSGRLGASAIRRSMCDGKGRSMQ